MFPPLAWHSHVCLIGPPIRAVTGRIGSSRLHFGQHLQARNVPNHLYVIAYITCIVPGGRVPGRHGSVRGREKWIKGTQRKHDPLREN